MKPSINLDPKWIGTRFGKLVVVSFGYDKKHKNYTWLCRCDCGNTTEQKPGVIKSGRKISCGCAQLESATTHGMRYTRLYRIWIDMRRRCRDKNHQTYKNYGGRGIFVCPEWNGSFEIFMAWAYKNGYSDNLTIDRKDVNGNYEPDNCRWTTTKEQARNRRNTRYVDIYGERLPISAAIEKYGNGIHMDTVLKRIDLHGYSVEDAITQPVHC